MSKYKLIKKYPGSPKVGFTVKYSTNECYEDACCNEYSINIIENNPEFWEKVVELDYEILSLKSVLFKGLYYYKDKDYLYRDKNDIIVKGRSLEDIYKQESVVSIYSVKRLSDGEIFTIGDRYEVKDPTKEFRTIATFYISDNKLYIISREYGYSELKEIYKAKQLLFKTEDGVDIFLHDKSWILHKTSLVLSNKPITHNNPDIIRTEDAAHWNFSTKEKAEEYILMNKPCLSIRDCMGLTSWLTMEEDLKDLVKKRL